MKLMARIVSLAVAVVLGFSVQAIAVPANPGVTEFVQPDGKRFAAATKGDEWTNLVETADGYAIARGGDGYWRYLAGYAGATPVLEPTRADAGPPAGIRKHLAPAPLAAELAPAMRGSAASLSQAPYGRFTGRVLFILASFSNRRPTYSASVYSSLLRNTVRSYYARASHGRASLLPAAESFGTANDGVVGWVNLGYAHPNTGSSTGLANQLIARNAILRANPYVNFAAYDTNRDGYVDSRELAVVVIVAGYERAYGNVSPSVWGHKWSIANYPVVDGKRVGAYHNGAGGYAQFGEIHRSTPTSGDAHPATAGIMVHELGHLIFGLPDLYDTDLSSSGVGGFCVMSYGSWGKANSARYAGQTPVMPSAWIRYNRGWAAAPNITSGTVSLTAAGSGTATASNTIRRRPTSVGSQFFLVETRRPLGYDLGLQRFLGTSFGGVAIWHIDQTRSSNANDARRLVDLEEADGTLMGRTGGSRTDLWYSGNRTLFNKSTVPNSRLYGGASSGAQIRTLSAPANVMRVNFSVLP